MRNAAAQQPLDPAASGAHAQPAPKDAAATRATSPTHACSHTYTHAEMGGAAVHTDVPADDDTRQHVRVGSPQPQGRRAHQPDEGPPRIDAIPRNQKSPRNRPNEKSSKLLSRMKLLLTYMRLSRRDGRGQEASQADAPLAQETDADGSRRPRRHVATLTSAKVGPRFNDVLRSLLHRRRGVG